MNDTIEPHDAVQGAVPAGPGARLRQVREAKRWSQSDVALRLHLDTRQVAALEADDFARLPEPIYVSGYLRNYSRLLGLPAQELVDAYQRACAPDAPVLAPLRPARRDAAVYQTAVQWGAVTVVAALLLLVSWHMHSTPPVPPLRAAARPRRRGGGRGADGRGRGDRRPCR